MGFIRFILALSVLIVHSSPIFGIVILPGYLAVETFYIISGFYMTLIFIEKYDRSGSPYYNFISNRVLRLYPLYLTVIVLVVVLSVVYGLWLGSYGKLQYYFDWYNREPGSLPSLVVILLSNILLIGQDIICHFELAADGTLQFLGLQQEIALGELLFIPIAWTIAVELCFYLATPFVVKRTVLAVLVLIALVLLLRALLYFAFDVGGGFAVYKFAPTEFFWFLLGVLSYKLYKNNWLPRSDIAWILLSVWTLSMFLYPYYQWDWVIFVFAFLFTPAIFYRFARNPTDRFLGDITYPLYIGHGFLLMIVSANSFPKPLGSGIPLLVLTLIFSVASYRFLLVPVDRYRASRVKS